MEAKVHNLEGHLSKQHGATRRSSAPVWATMRWKLALASILLAIILALAAGAFLYFEQEDSPMQVEPMTIMV